MESPPFRHVALNHYERTCPECHGSTYIQRNFMDLRWHCILCGARSSAAERAQCPPDMLPCGHDTMYGDRDEPMEAPCATCNGTGRQEASYFDLVAMGIITVDEDPVVIADIPRHAVPALPRTARSPQIGPTPKRKKPRGRKKPQPALRRREPPRLHIISRASGVEQLAQQVQQHLNKGQSIPPHTFMQLIQQELETWPMGSHDHSWWVKETILILMQNGVIERQGKTIYVP